jgi:hypothetical protein
MGSCCGRCLVTVCHQSGLHRFLVTNTIQAIGQCFPSFCRVMCQACFMGQFLRAGVIFGDFLFTGLVFRFGLRE